MKYWARDSFRCKHSLTLKPLKKRVKPACLQAAALVAALFGQPLTAATLTVSVSNIQSDVGEMNVAIYDNKKDWLGDNTVEKRSIDVSDNTVNGVIQTRFELAPGEYAVSVHHDDNDNGKMDTNFIGIPKEPTGLSNGAVPKFGPPKYTDAVFTLTVGGLEMPIELLD